MSLELPSAASRPNIPNPPKTGRVDQATKLSWWFQAEWKRGTGPGHTIWCAKVELPPVIAGDIASAWKEIQNRIDRCHSFGCFVQRVTVRGSPIGETAAASADWTMEVCVPVGFDPIKSGMARPY